MKEFEFKRTGALQSVKVDGKELSFNGESAAKTLVWGEFYVEWAAGGNEGQAYGLSYGRRGQAPITHFTGTLGPSRQKSGNFWIVV